MGEFAKRSKITYIYFPLSSFSSPSSSPSSLRLQRSTPRTKTFHRAAKSRHSLPAFPSSLSSHSTSPHGRTRQDDEIFGFTDSRFVKPPQHSRANFPFLKENVSLESPGVRGQSVSSAGLSEDTSYSYKPTTYSYSPLAVTSTYLGQLPPSLPPPSLPLSSLPPPYLQSPSPSPRILLPVSPQHYTQGYSRYPPQTSPKQKRADQDSARQSSLEVDHGTEGRSYSRITRHF